MSKEASSSSAVRKNVPSASSSESISRKPKYSRFTQQELPAWKPIRTPGCVITSFALIAIVFIPIGLFSLFASEHVVEIAHRYDEDCIPHDYIDQAISYIQSSDTNKTCTRKFIIQKHMKAPVYVYYQLDNYYQNHRRYVKSRNDYQLRFKGAEWDISNCSPEDKFIVENGSLVPIVPCGLTAWSLFNDTYRFSMKDKDLEISKRNIAWKSDQSKKFGSDVYPQNFQISGLIGGAKLNESIPLSEQMDLMVWMRLAALPTFRKLYGKIEADLEVNDEVDVVIENNYNTYSFGGKKRLVLSTTNWIGGKNDFLGIAYLTIGGLALFFAIGFVLLYVIMPRPLEDPSYLCWDKNSGNIR